MKLTNLKDNSDKIRFDSRKDFEDFGETVLYFEAPREILPGKTAKGPYLGEDDVSASIIICLPYNEVRWSRDLTVSVSLVDKEGESYFYCDVELDAEETGLFLAVYYEAEIRTAAGKALEQVLTGINERIADWEGSMVCSGHPAAYNRHDEAVEIKGLVEKQLRLLAGQEQEGDVS